MRLEAFKSLCAERGIELAEDDVIDTEWNTELLDAYLLAGPKHTALVCEYDQLAAQVIERATALGIRIPEDLSVVGFDSTAFCNELRPSLTSVRQPLFEMGQRAIEVLVQDMRGESESPTESIIPCGFDIRGSTAPRRAQAG